MSPNRNAQSNPELRNKQVAMLSELMDLSSGKLMLGCCTQCCFDGCDCIRPEGLYESIN